MACCSKSGTYFESALRRAFFSSGQSRLLFILLAVALHAALLSSLPANAPLHAHHWQELSAHVERRQPVQMVNISSVFAANTTHALAPVKVKPKKMAVPSLPKTIAEAPSETPQNELVAAPPQITPASTGPVVGIALPQSGIMQGGRRFWSFQQGATMPDEQARRQAQMQREAQLAMQTERNAARGKFEAQLMTALSSVQLSSPCRVIIPPAAAIQLHCQHDSDANSVRAVLDQFVNAPPAQTEATWVAIDLTPRESGGPEAISRHSNSELPLQ